jgi:tetratricopeptide (TPR) repeat protein
MRSWTVLAILSVSLLAGQRALAAKPQAKERAAKKACLSGEYAKGVAILAELYVDTNDSNYLFNQGRCYEQNIKFSEAAERFKEFLRKAPNLSESERADVDKHIADCEAAAAKAQAHGTAAEPSPTATPVQPPAASAGATANTSPTVPVATAENTAPTSTLTQTSPGTATPAANPWQHTAKWVASGTAAALLAVGVVEHIRYDGKNSDYNNARCSGGAYCQGLADSADAAKTWAIVGYSAAAVATGAAIAFWLTDSPRPQPGQQAGLGFSCVPALAGVACQGRF